MTAEPETTLPTCYRHHDRETRLSCSRCGRPVCVECVRSAPVGQLCPECSRPEPGARVITARQMGMGGGGLRESAPVTFWLIVACVAVFVGNSLFGVFGAFGAQYNDAVAAGQWWRIVTAAFLHGGLLHIMFNMYALYLFGPGIERQVGSPAFLALYLGAAMLGGAAYYLPYALGSGGVGPAVGASGAVFGLFGAALVGAFRARSTAAGAAGFRQLLTLLAINLALPLLVPNIAWQAHVGGLVAGVVVAGLWALVGRRRSGAAVARTLAGTAVAAVALGLVLLV